MSDEQKVPGMRIKRHVYHINGHAKLHHPNPPEHAHSNDPRLQAQVVPFEIVLRRRDAIDSDGVMDEVRNEVRQHVVEQLKSQDSPYIVGDVMIRGVNHLHWILVDENDPDGPAARILS